KIRRRRRRVQRVLSARRGGVGEVPAVPLSRRWASALASSCHGAGCGRAVGILGLLTFPAVPSLFDPAHQPADLDGRLVAALERVGLAFRVLLWEKAKAVREAASLSPIQIQILVFLRYHGEDLARVGRLAEELGLTPATVSDAVAALVAKGLVAKAPGATDRRVQRLCLTAAGARAAEALGDWADAVRGPLAGLSET